MSQNSKVNETLRGNILTSLSISPKSNRELKGSLIANPFIPGSNNADGRYSLRAIQEATQKLAAAGVISTSVNWRGKTVYASSGRTGNRYAVATVDLLS